MSAPDAALEAAKLAAVAGQDAMLAELEADDTFAPPLPDDDFFFDDDPLELLTPQNHFFLIFRIFRKNRTYSSPP